MALGDGITWDETLPADSTVAVQIDDYNRDLRVGVRKRMANEHEWPSSQSATGEGGKHKFITFQSQGAKPTLAGTQVNAIYASTDNLFFEKSDGTVVQIVAGTGVGDGKLLANATDAVASYLNSKVDTGYFTISGTNLILSSDAVDIYRYTSLSASTQENARSLKMCFGSANIGGIAQTSITNLPFANATSYRLTLNYADSGAFDDGHLSSVNVSASECSIGNDQGSARDVVWIAIGV